MSMEESNRSGSWGGRGDDDDDDEGRGGGSWGGRDNDDRRSGGSSWGGSSSSSRGSSIFNNRNNNNNHNRGRDDRNWWDNNRDRDRDWWDDDDDNDWWKKIFGRSSKYKKKTRPLNRSYASRRRYVNPNSFLKNWWAQFITPTFGWPWPASPFFPTTTPYTGGIGLPLPGYGGGYGTQYPYGYPPGYGVPGLITPTPSYTPPLPVPVSYKTTPGYPYNTVTPQYSSPYYY